MRNIYQIRVTLLGLRPPIWRLLWVAGATRLPHFNIALQVAMGWSNIHLHQFEKGGLCYGIPDPFSPGSIRSEADYRLDDLLREAGDTLVYRYDLGDDWAHRVRLEKILPYDERVALPLCLRGRRACPLEDIGGPPGYKAFLHTLSDSADPRHAELQDWIGGEFDPDRLDVAQINAALEEYCQ